MWRDFDSGDDTRTRSIPLPQINLKHRTSMINSVVAFGRERETPLVVHQMKPRELLVQGLKSCCRLTLRLDLK